MVGGCILLWVWVDNSLRRCLCSCSYCMCKFRTPALHSCSINYFAFVAISFVCTFLFYSFKFVLSVLLLSNFKLIQQWVSWSCHLTGWQYALPMVCQMHGKISSTQSNWAGSAHILVAFFRFSSLYEDGQCWYFFFCLDSLLFHSQIATVLLKTLYHELLLLLKFVW